MKLSNLLKAEKPTGRVYQELSDICTPLIKQQAAHDAEEKFILYGGCMGGGKSFWLSAEALLHCLRYPKARVLLVRQHLSSLKKTTIQTLESILPVEELKKYNRSEGVYTFKNGSRIFLGGLGDDLRSLQKYKSMELSMICVEQAEETSESAFQMLASRLRLKGDWQFKFLCTCNACSNWPRARWIDKALPDHRFIQSLPSENPYLDSGYIDGMREILPEQLFQAWMLGDFSAISDEATIFSYQDVLDAMKRKCDPSQPVMYAVDVSRYGGDESVICKKAGNVISIVEVFSKVDLMEGAGKVIRAVDANKSVLIVVDATGLGAGLLDRLREQGYHAKGFVSSSRPKNPRMYKNLRAEAWFELKNKLKELSLPSDEKLRAQLVSLRYFTTSDGVLQVEGKDQIKSRGLPSPDRADALMMVCSEEFRQMSETEIAVRLPVVQSNPIVAKAKNFFDGDTKPDYSDDATKEFDAWFKARGGQRLLKTRR